MVFNMRNTGIYILFLMVISISCNKDDFRINNLDGKITILGHGGMGITSTYPIDTYESIIKCLNSGADGTELDIQMTKDSVLVAFHDHDLSDQTNLSGVINDYNWNEIKDAFYTSTPYLNYSILSLDSLFSHINDLSKYLFTFDCKLYSNDDPENFKQTFANAISKLISKYNLENNVFIESQDKNFLLKLKKINPEYKLYIYPSSFQEGLETATSIGLYGITISTKIITKEQIQIAHENNLHITIWGIHTVNKNKEAILKNPDHIQTDKVKHLVKLLK